MIFATGRIDGIMNFCHTSLNCGFVCFTILFMFCFVFVCFFVVFCWVFLCGVGVWGCVEVSLWGWGVWGCVCLCAFVYVCLSFLQTAGIYT